MIITNYKLFENSKLEYQWSDYYLNKNDSLKEMYNNLEIIKENGIEYVILHHFGSKEAYEPKINYLGELKKMIYNKMDWNKTPNSEEIESFYEKIQNLTNKNIDRLEITKFLTYDKIYEPNPLILNTISNFLGFDFYDDFKKSLNIEDFVITTGLDPNYFGSNQGTKNDIAQLSFSVIMFYVNLRDKEKFFENDSYFKIKYPLNKLYPTQLDPLNIGENKFFKEKMDIAKNNGYEGQIVTWNVDQDGNKQYRCDIWEFIPITYLKNGNLKESKYLLEFEK